MEFRIRMKTRQADEVWLQDMNNIYPSDRSALLRLILREAYASGRADEMKRLLGVRTSDPKRSKQSLHSVSEHAVTNSGADTPTSEGQETTGVSMQVDDQPANPDHSASVRENPLAEPPEQSGMSDSPASPNKPFKPDDPRQLLGFFG